MPFISPAQAKLEQVNEQMELWAIWDNILTWSLRLAQVARNQRHLCKVELRQLERQIGAVMQHRLAT